MTTKRIAIDGEWFTIQAFTQDDGTIRLEMFHEIKNKYYKMYPDNILELGGQNDNNEESSSSTH